MRAALLVAVLASWLTACGGRSATPDASGLGPTANLARGIADTDLAIDVTALTGTATLMFEPSTEPGGTVEIGDLAIESVRVAGADLAFAITAGKLDLALPASDAPTAVTFTYRWQHHEGFEGVSASGYTLTWPYYCGNVFPCHSDPADGTTFSLALTGVAAGKTAVYPARIPAEAPAYQIAWSIDEYTELALGATTAGTALSVWYRPGELATAQQGSEYLVAAFDWLEKTIGPYKFGPKAGTVSAKWGAGAFGGMEHHPFWHVGTAALGDVETTTHEAVHGWFGGGIRINCWEDFVLSEGTVTYLAGRALDVVAPTVGDAIWQSYQNDLGEIAPADKVWPASCGMIDVLEDRLFTRAPYMRGAFFYRGVALKVGADKLDEALRAFYTANATKPATMQSMLDTIRTVTGYDPTACANMWLRSSTIPAVGACP
ncbi:MAG: peptidase M1 [Deltaproteobacteria bacterium]|nr:peptidase M1 [Deltaproteobacteria bacterium]MDQ3298715.1 peptidase M1 [Myxococcota bacterium]